MLGGRSQGTLPILHPVHNETQSVLCEVRPVAQKAVEIVNAA